MERPGPDFHAPTLAMIRVIYVSSAAVPFSEAQLVQLLSQCQANNRRAGITGMLLYQDGQFMQALEGEASAIHSLLSRIAADPRHEGMVRLLEEPIGERDFAGWSMGFENLRTTALDHLPPFSEFRGCDLTGPEFRGEPSKARRLLQLFRNSGGSSSGASQP